MKKKRIKKIKLSNILSIRNASHNGFTKKQSVQCVEQTLKMKLTQLKKSLERKLMIKMKKETKTFLEKLKSQLLLDRESKSYSNPFKTSNMALTKYNWMPQLFKMPVNLEEQEDEINHRNLKVLRSRYSPQLNQLWWLNKTITMMNNISLTKLL